MNDFDIILSETCLINFKINNIEKKVIKRPIKVKTNKRTITDKQKNILRERLIIMRERKKKIKDLKKIVKINNKDTFIEF